MFSISTLFLLKIYSGKSELGLYDISFKNLQVIEQYQSQKGLFLVFAMIDRICSKRLICLKFARGFGVIGGAQITLTPRMIDICISISIVCLLRHLKDVISRAGMR
jgi:hypothetical protein